MFDNKIQHNHNELSNSLVVINNLAQLLILVYRLFNNNCSLFNTEA